MLTGSAFILGLLGSLHCVGMCGPIALAVTGNNRYFRHKLLYNLGRTTTYIGLGALLGFLGMGISMAGSQQFLSIFMGVTLIVVAIFTIPGKQVSIKPVQWLVNQVKHWMGKYIKSDSFIAPYLIGVINGFLPCGLVYIAIAGAIATGSATGGALYMALFGLGTIPVLLALAYSWSVLKRSSGMNLKKAVPVFVTIIGILFILRGLDLGIPYISPKLKSNPTEMHHGIPNPSEDIRICND